MTGPAVLVESCVDSLDAACASAAAGAGRLELCDHLDVGGTTPAPALVSAVVAAVDVPVHVMVRPRGGSFVYDPDEVRRMLADIDAVRAAGAHGIVAGGLTAGCRIDAALMAEFVDRARPLPVTCHRAFDDAADLDAALEALIGAGVVRVLSGGGPGTAAEGIAVLARLVGRAAGHLAVMAGGNVRPHNVRALVASTGVAEVHARIIREPGPADAFTRARWTADVAALVAAAAR